MTNRLGYATGNNAWETGSLVEGNGNPFLQSTEISYFVPNLLTSGFYYPNFPNSNLNSNSNPNSNLNSKPPTQVVDRNRPNEIVIADILNAEIVEQYINHDRLGLKEGFTSSQACSQCNTQCTDRGNKPYGGHCFPTTCCEACGSAGSSPWCVKHT